MRVLEYGKSNPKTLLFLPCTAEPEWAFTASVTLLAQDYHVMQVVYDGHGETGEDFVSVEHTVEEIIGWLHEHGISSLDAAYGCSLGGACLTRFLAVGGVKVEQAIAVFPTGAHLRHPRHGVRRACDHSPTGILSAGDGLSGIRLMQ